MRQVITIFLGLLVAACSAGQPKPVVGVEGKRSYLVECLDKERNCYPQAKQLCPEGYRVTDSKYRAVMNWQGFEVENTLKYSLVIECHE